MKPNRLFNGGSLFVSLLHMDPGGGVTLMRWTDAQALYASYKKFRFKVAKFKY